MTGVAIIGGGPAGLMAAEVLSQEGWPVTIYERMPTLGRKFLMAGKSGLNLTKSEPLVPLLASYREAGDWLRPAIEAFGPEEIRSWAQALGQDTFIGSTGRVFPTAMKASPLLRAWIGRLTTAGVEIRTRWRWTGWQSGAVAFDTPGGARHVTPAATVLALGGASWARLGSDGSWASWLAERALPLRPFAASNVGLVVAWSPPMARHFGTPLKSIALHAGAQVSRGECVLSSRGLEGGGIYMLTPALREGAPLSCDLAPDQSADRLTARLAKVPAKSSLSNRLRKAARLEPAQIALFREFTPTPPRDPQALAARLKALPILHAGLRPMDEAISTAGGLGRDALDADFMIRALPGVFAAGEMLDWDAPTGGYLLTAALASGRWAGAGAARWLSHGDAARTNQ